uniref:Uncharacterized protein n=1 Tax=Podarcis muralis TaxID=64176 RepID=A0A670IT98_PODMU
MNTSTPSREAQHELRSSQQQESSHFSQAPGSSRLFTPPPPDNERNAEARRREANLLKKHRQTQKAGGGGISSPEEEAVNPMSPRSRHMGKILGISVRASIVPLTYRCQWSSTLLCFSRPSTGLPVTVLYKSLLCCTKKSPLITF